MREKREEGARDGNTKGGKENTAERADKAEKKRLSG